MAATVMTGMEIQAIRRLARTMDDRAAEIERLLGTATSRVHSLNWRGNDRNRFVNDWDSQHAPKLRTVATGLRAAADDARRKATEQERISRAH